jgi:hypothetical protein
MRMAYCAAAIGCAVELVVTCATLSRSLARSLSARSDTACLQNRTAQDGTQTSPFTRPPPHSSHRSVRAKKASCRPLAPAPAAASLRNPRSPALLFCYYTAPVAPTLRPSNRGQLGLRRTLSLAPTLRSSKGAGRVDGVLERPCAPAGTPSSFHTASKLPYSFQNVSSFHAPPRRMQSDDVI